MGEVHLISWTQKLVLYETKSRYYIVGSNKAETRFRVLKIDRTEPRELLIHDDKVEYSRCEIHSVLSMIDGGNKTKKQFNSGLLKNISAFGIAGFVRFLEGHYMILITKRKKVALIGPHAIYKIEDTSMLYIPHDTVRQVHPDENRYVKMFQNVDLSSNFYFSYSYDLTHSLQYNMTSVIEANNTAFTDKSSKSDENCSDSQTFLRNGLRQRSSSSRLDFSWQDETDRTFLEQSLSNGGHPSEDTPIPNVIDLPPTSQSYMLQPVKRERGDSKRGKLFHGVKNEPHRKYVWNNHLLKNFENCVHSDWVLYIIHGFIGQNNVNVFGKALYLTLIGRRSNMFAGTRFLKRGTNHEGYVANEVETEQIIQDTAVTFLESGKVSSFVQVRGSVPLFWSQDIVKMVPKPPISLDQRDPYCGASGMHFNQMLRRYGSPVIILNLVKTREKKRHESILCQDYIDTVEYLNQFLPAEHTIKYIGFDMARLNKRKDVDVMLRLNKIAQSCMKRTGFFLSVQPSQAQYLLQDPELQSLKGVWGPTGMRQAGVVRTNCVDCLDRTNTAQFAMGRRALAYQLYALGVLERPHLEFDTDCVKLLEELYEDHGDTMALQYGGSQLVHRIKTYRKIAPWTLHTRDIMQTLSRYYSNAFSDLEKQQAFNLFLGVFIPRKDRINLWDLPTDYYLHNRVSLDTELIRNNYCQWWDSGVWETLSMPRDDVCKAKEVQAAILTAPQGDEHVDSFYEYYRPEELSVFHEMYQTLLSQSCLKHMPKNATDFSPFCVRDSADSSLEKGSEANVAGKKPTSLITSIGSEGSSESSSDSDGEGGGQFSDTSSSGTSDDEGNYVSFKELFPSMKEVYDTEITSPTARDLKIYERYVNIGVGQNQDQSSVSPPPPPPQRPCSLTDPPKPRPLAMCISQTVDIYPVSAFKLDSSFFVEPPPVSRHSKDIYAAYINKGVSGPGPVSEADTKTYKSYVNKFLYT